jgi:hypothetical protein
MIAKVVVTPTAKRMYASDSNTIGISLVDLSKRTFDSHQRWDFGTFGIW